MAATAKCPHCETAIDGPAGTDSVIVSSAGGRAVYAIVCGACRAILGVVGQAPR